MSKVFHAKQRSLRARWENLVARLKLGPVLGHHEKRQISSDNLQDSKIKNNQSCRNYRFVASSGPRESAIGSWRRERSRARHREQEVRGPILITRTRNDKAVGIAYPIASRINGVTAAALGDANDKFGGLGCNGTQTTNSS
jgi:hypothetical protein